MASAPSPSSSTKLSVKLLIDTKREKVLFAEASKAVIDFLFNLLSFPIGAVVRLLTKNQMVGSLGNLYESVEQLNHTYMQPNQNKDVLLKPTSLISSSVISGLLPPNDVLDSPVNVESLKFYTCHNKCSYVTCKSGTSCPSNDYSSCIMNSQLSFVGNIPVLKDVSSTNVNGFVKDVVTYMVMDDLVIQPMSTISSITLLNKFDVKEIGLLEERVVELGMEEGINLLKSSLQSKTVLTNVFLKKPVKK
ncbi:hypothetical protein TanjilG_30450 [Lupinus angustifolius]|uniref:uncharacterized protein LOC109335392 n=1 Tax=Lupinus angustifolius TaxID=3871 RepID=UPI00090D62A6|nr:PREDICTED: uncharacterized protein LOC109335392 [Lupinus angustifolius]OIV91228.1 hypothetical protein TanjilG_30450 [Lupinus angustifolius]